MKNILVLKITLPDASVYYVSDYEFTTSSTDTPPNTIIRGDIRGKLPYRKSVSFYIWGGESQATIGNLTLDNTPRRFGANKGQGRYDHFLTQQIRDGVVEAFLMQPFTDLKNATIVGTFIIDSSIKNTRNEITIGLGDNTSKLENTTTHEYFPNAIQYVLNRGIAEGIVLGTFSQVPLQLVNETTNLYQVHSGASIVNTTALEDRKDPFTAGLEYTAVTVADTGGWGYDLFSPPDGTITADGVGAEYDNKGSMENTKFFQWFARYLLEEHAGYDSSDIDTASLANIDSVWNLRYGYWIQQPTSVKQILSEAMVGHLGCYYQNSQGQLVFGYLSAPSGTSVLTVDKSNITEDIEIVLDRAPRLSDSFANEPNWYVFTREDIENISGLSENDKLLATRQYRNLYTSPDTTGGGSPYADEYDHAVGADYTPTMCTNSGNNATLAANTKTIYLQARYFYTFGFIAEDPLTVLSLELLDPITLEFDRYGLDAGKQLRIVEIKSDDLLSEDITIVGWG